MKKGGAWLYTSKGGESSETLDHLLSPFPATVVNIWIFVHVIYIIKCFWQAELELVKNMKLCRENNWIVALYFIIHR